MQLRYTILIILFVITTLVTPLSVLAEQYSIPNWIKNNARWWSENKITDHDFLQGIQYLVQQKILKVPQTETQQSSKSQIIPEWIKNNAGWWSNDLISDKDFVSGIQYLIQNNIINIDEKIPSSNNIALMIPILNQEDPIHDLDLFREFLRSGDILVFPPKNYNEIHNIKDEIPGILLGTGGTSISSILPNITKLPSGIDIITYDYERDFTSEWTRNQNDSIKFFQQLKQEAHKNNKQLAIVPVFIFGANWDWGEVAKNTDILVVQVQNFQTGADLPDALTSKGLGVDLKQVTEHIVKQVRTKSPSTKIYLQFGFEVTDNADNVLIDIETVKNLGIDGVTLWYNPGTYNTTSKIVLLEDLLQKIYRK